MSGVVLLQWLGSRTADDEMLAAAAHLDSAVVATLARGDALTRDLGGSAATAEFADAVISSL